MAKIKVNKKMQLISNAKKRADQADPDYLRMIKKAVKIGNQVLIEKGRSKFCGEVTRLSSWTDEIWIINPNTGKEYGVGFYFVKDIDSTATKRQEV